MNFLANQATFCGKPVPGRWEVTTNGTLVRAFAGHAAEQIARTYADDANYAGKAAADANHFGTLSR